MPSDTRATKDAHNFDNPICMPEDRNMIIVIDNQTYYSASELKRMGRTERQIRALGEPDTTAPNPYGWSSPMKLYAEARVHADDSAKAVA